MWAGRDAEEPGSIPPGRGPTEPYFIRPFKNISFLEAVQNGSMPLTGLLVHRSEGNWAVPAAEYMFHGADSVTRV